MDLIRALSTRIALPLYDRWNDDFSPQTARYIRASQYRSADQIRAEQLIRLKRLLAFVYDSNSFYRSRMDSVGMTPDDLLEHDDLQAMPILTKDDIREHQDQMISRGYRAEDLFFKRTGGSTGVPLKLYWTLEAKQFKFALGRRHDSWAGYRPGVKRAALWGDVSTQKELSWRGRILSFLFGRTIFLDTLNMNDEHMAAFADRIRQYCPTVLFGHAHSIYEFARFLNHEGIELRCFEGIITTAEMLLPGERIQIENTFGPIVFDRYGCEELSVIASECEAHDGLHIAAEGLIVELLPVEGLDAHRLVITDLTNYGMPLIRYAVGDLASPKQGVCACGRQLPRLGKIIGRTTDVLYTPDGRRVSGVSILDTFTIHLPGIKQTQIVQDALNHLVFRIVRGPGFSDESLAALDEQVPKYFGPSMTYDIEYLDKIPLTSRGKFQFSICQIPPPD